MVGRVLFELTKKLRLLVPIFCRMSSKECPVLTLSRPANGVELVVAQDRASRTCFAHRAGNPQDFSLFRTAVNKVADKDHSSFWMPESTCDLHIVEFV